MQIFIKFSDNTKITLEIENNDTIIDLKQKILDKKGIPIKQQRLSFSGQDLVDFDRQQIPKTLADYSIQKESTIDLIVEDAKYMDMFCFGWLKVVNGWGC